MPSSVAAAASAVAIEPRRDPGNAGADLPIAGGWVDVDAAAVGTAFGRAGPGGQAMATRGLEAAAANAALSDPPDGAPIPWRPRLPMFRSSRST